MTHLLDWRFHHHRGHIPLIALILLAALVMIVTITLPAHKPAPEPVQDNLPTGLP